MSGLRERECESNRLQVAHLADEQDVGVLAQCAAQRIVEARGVFADLALIDSRYLMGVHVLDRIFDRDDVHPTVAVDPVDETCERGALAAAGRSGDEDEATSEVGPASDCVRYAEPLERGDLMGNDAKRNADTAPLTVGVATNPRLLSPGEGEVELPRLSERRAADAAEHAGEQRFGIARHQRCVSVERL